METAAATVEPVMKSKAKPKAKPKVKTPLKTPVKTPVKSVVKPAVDPPVDSPVKPEVDPAVKPVVDPAVTPVVDPAGKPSVDPAGEAGSPVTPKVPKKRGRPVGWRKYKEGESPPAKPKKARKSKTSVSSPGPSRLESGEGLVSSSENMETPGRPSGSSANTERVTEVPEAQLTKSAEDLPILPPKKFFKSKAALKESPVPASVTVSPPPSPPNHEEERDNFRSWLDAKLSGQNGVETEGISEIFASVGSIALVQPQPIRRVQNSVE